MDGLKVKVVLSLLLAFQESRGFQFPASSVPNDNDGTEKAFYFPSCSLKEEKSFPPEVSRQSFSETFSAMSSGSLVSGDYSSSLIGQSPRSASFAQSGFIVNNSTVGTCICVTSGSCALANGGSGSSNDGSGTIDVRIVNVSCLQIDQLGQWLNRQIIESAAEKTNIGKKQPSRSVNRHNLI